MNRIAAIFIIMGLFLTAGVPVCAQEQSRESMAVDATASQWSFQFAYEGFFDYRDDTMKNGMQRPEGNK